MNIAIFDIDGTLVRGSTERRFWRYLAAHRRLGPRQLVAFVWFLIRQWPRFGVDVFKKNKAYLVGLDKAEVELLATRFVDDHILDLLYAPAVQRLEHHLRCGDVVVLLSGTLEPIAKALAQRLGVAHVLATRCEEREGRYLAAPPLSHPYDEAKLDIAHSFATTLGVSLTQASAYGDSVHDQPLLAAVGKPVAICPDSELLQTAASRNWEIIFGADARHPITQ